LRCEHGTPATVAAAWCGLPGSDPGQRRKGAHAEEGEPRGRELAAGKELSARAGGAGYCHGGGSLPRGRSLVRGQGARARGRDTRRRRWKGEDGGAYGRDRWGEDCGAF
jgi:hypothetical protein